MNEHLGDLSLMIRQLRAELEWAGRTGIVPPEVSLPVDEPDAPAEETPEEAAPLFRGSPPPEQAPPPDDEDRWGPPPGDARPTPPVEPERRADTPRDPEPAEAQRPRVERPAPNGAPGVQSRLQVVQSLLGKCGSLEEVREVVADCTRCKLSTLGRTNIVFGVGNPAAEIMFVGEGPGGDEDRQGEPFVGKAGQLLTKIIEGGMRMKRSDVYIANIVKCRPPKNRDPEPDEIEMCRPFVDAQIRLINPKVIITLGRYASQTLLGTTEGMKRMRGQWRSYRGTQVMPTFHPAYLLRNEADKGLVWADIQEVLRFLGRPVPVKG